MIALINHDYSSLLTNETQKNLVRTNLNWNSLQLLSHISGCPHISSSGSIRVETREVQTGSKGKCSAHRNNLVLEQVALRLYSLSPTGASRPDWTKWVTWSDLRSNPGFEQKVGPGNLAVPSNLNYQRPEKVLLISGSKAPKPLIHRLPTEDAHKDWLEQYLCLIMVCS